MLLVVQPYYSEDGITIYHGDCREILPQLPKVDLVLTDPPYNAGKQYGDGTNDNVPWGEYCQWLAGIVDQLEEKCAGMVLVFLSVNGMLNMASVKRPRHVCSWDKPMSLSPRQGGSAFLPHWEPCLVYGRPWGEGGRVPDYHLPDVWHHNPSKRNGHPCPKPESLMQQIISAIPAGTILDPFMGSGTTLVAAKRLGRRAIGVEIEERYCQIAVERLRQQALPLAAPAPQIEQPQLF